MHTHNYTFCHSHTQYTHDSHTSTPTYLHTSSHTPIPSHSRTYPQQCTHPHTFTHVLTHAYSHVQFCQKCTKATSTSFGFAKETRLQRPRKKIAEKNFVKRKEMSGGKLTLIKFWAFFKLSFFLIFLVWPRIYVWLSEQKKTMFVFQLKLFFWFLLYLSFLLLKWSWKEYLIDKTVCRSLAKNWCTSLQYIFCHCTEPR